MSKNVFFQVITIYSWLIYIGTTTNLAKYAEILEYWPAQPDNPSGIRVASVIEFSVCLFSVGSLYVCYKFSNSLQHNIRPPSHN